MEQLPGIGFPRETASHKSGEIVKVRQDCMTKCVPDFFSTQATLKTLHSLQKINRSEWFFCRQSVLTSETHFRITSDQIQFVHPKTSWILGNNIAPNTNFLNLTMRSFFHTKPITNQKCSMSFCCFLFCTGLSVNHFFNS